MTPPDGAPTRGVHRSITRSLQRAAAPFRAQRDHWLAAYGGIITAIVLTVTTLICYAIGLEAPVLSRAERPVVLESMSLTTAISGARDDLESPFAYLMAAAPQGLFGSAGRTANDLAITAGLPPKLNTDLYAVSGNFYPRIAFAAAGALTVLVFLLIMRHLRVRHPVIWTLLFATNVIFIYYARTAVSVAPLILVWALLLFLIFILLTEIDAPRTWHVAGLAAVFTMLPMVHWYGLIMLFALEFPVLTMLWSRRHLPGRRWLLWLAVHAFLFVHFVAWGDVEINLGEAQFVPRTAVSELGRALNVEDIYLIFGRLVGGGGWWVWLWLVVLVGAALAWLARVSRSGRSDKGSGEVTRLALAGRVCLVWVIGFVVLASFLPGGLLVFLRVYPVLLLPLMIVFAWGATGLMRASDWRLRTLAIGLVGAALVSNLVNSVPYVAAGAQFNDWKPVGRLGW